MKAPVSTLTQEYTKYYIFGPNLVGWTCSRANLYYLWPNCSKLAESTYIKTYTIGKLRVSAFQRCVATLWHLSFSENKPENRYFFTPSPYFSFIPPFSAPSRTPGEWRHSESTALALSFFLNENQVWRGAAIYHFRYSWPVTSMSGLQPS